MAAEGRARDIARTIAEGMNTGTQRITEQYQSVRRRDRRGAQAHDGVACARSTSSATGDAQVDVPERDRALHRNRAEHEADGGRHAARTRNTRQELRRGILELPQETAESAAQMRRVIVDQIEALAELNRIVARHGREFEDCRAGA